MSFSQKYNETKNLVKDDLEHIEIDLTSFCCGNDNLQSSLENILKAPSKRIRPVLAIFFMKAFDIKITQKQYAVLSAIEIIHNATLIHDDVIDNSEKRRNQETINSKFNNSLAVISGDYLLSVALKKIINIGNIKILNSFTKAIEDMTSGEIEQYFSKFKIPTIKEYLIKSKRKTARLFITLFESIALLEKNIDKNIAIQFAENFGIAFQIRDDLLNFIDDTSDKPKLNDIKDGIYTAPVIFSDNMNNIDIGIEKTKELLDNYLNSTVDLIKNAPNKKYKTELIKLVELFKL